MIQGNIRGRGRRLEAHRSLLSDGAVALIPRLVNHPNTKLAVWRRRPSMVSEWPRSANCFRSVAAVDSPQSRSDSAPDVMLPPRLPPTDSWLSHVLQASRHRAPLG